MTEYVNKLRHLSPEELKARRAQILNELGMTYRQFIAYELNDGLKEEEKHYEREMDAIDFLLGEWSE